MPRWEYLERSAMYEDAEPGWLNGYGAQGWEVVAAVPLIAPVGEAGSAVGNATVGYHVIFRRMAEEVFMATEELETQTDAVAANGDKPIDAEITPEVLAAQVAPTAKPTEADAEQAGEATRATQIAEDEGSQPQE